MCCTQMVKDLKKPTFGDIFTVPVPANKIYTKTLQVTVWNVRDQNEKCVVCYLKKHTQKNDYPTIYFLL